MKRFIERTLFMVFRTTSIKSRLKISYVVILILLMIPCIISITFSNILTSNYSKLIHNVDYANTLNQVVKSDITNEIWNIVSGKTSYADGNQYAIINQVYNGLSVLNKNAGSNENRRLIDVATRAMKTLESYVDRLGRQIEAKAAVADNEQLLEEIRGVSVLVYDVIQEFIFSEIKDIAQVNTSLQRSGVVTTILEIALFIGVIIFAIFTFTSVSESISSPILRLKNMAVRIAEGDLEARAEPTDVDELKGLTESLNTMAGRIGGLIDENIRELQNLQKSEMKALQAQIAPHFLYNTFDTIIWLAESGKNQEVVQVTMALSNYFRISLSKGRDWITVDEEVEHVKSYLTIQRIRYESILDYRIDVDERILSLPILKLILQPLVENALYHGIKFRRTRGGIILVKGWLQDNQLCFSVEDNGIGIEEERLNLIRDQISDERDIETLGYGIYNVNKRLKLYYEISSGLSIDSTYGQGTRVSFKLPIRECA